MSFNENTRVKIPAILHLCRLGFKYLSLKNCKWDLSTNIFAGIFAESILSINLGIDESDVKRTLEKVSLVLDSDDLGEAFFNMMNSSTGVKLIDFSTPEN